ncbi:heme exporter protein CcmD [Jannaschia marina]|nr:heme exporter protein CcmD [Jannaschia marina]
MSLGPYAFDILLAYGLSGILVAGLVWQSIASARAARRRLEDAEK